MKPKNRRREHAQYRVNGFVSKDWDNCSGVTSTRQVLKLDTNERLIDFYEEQNDVPVAQWIERNPATIEVSGSSPLRYAKKKEN